MAWFDEAIADAERQRYVPTLALAYNLRGVTLRRRGRLDEAERCHRAALALYVDRAAPAGLSLSLASLGYIVGAARRRCGRTSNTTWPASTRPATPATCGPQALALEGSGGRRVAAR